MKPQTIANAINAFHELDGQAMAAVLDKVSKNALRQIAEIAEEAEAPDLLTVYDETIDAMRGPEVEELFHALARRLPPRLLAWAERGWNV